MKSPYYVATTTAAYRQKIDDYMNGTLKPDEYYRNELEKVSHRDYTTAFYDRPTDERDQNYGTSSYIRSYDYAGVVQDYDPETGYATIEQRNKVNRGERLEVLQAGERDFLTIEDSVITDMNGEPIESTPHAKMLYRLKTPPVKPMDIIRKQV